MTQYLLASSHQKTTISFDKVIVKLLHGSIVIAHCLLYNDVVEGINPRNSMTNNVITDTLLLVQKQYSCIDSAKAK